MCLNKHQRHFGSVESLLKTHLSKIIIIFPNNQNGSCGLNVMETSCRSLQVKQYILVQTFVQKVKKEKRKKIEVNINRSVLEMKKLNYGIYFFWCIIFSLHFALKLHLHPPCSVYNVYAIIHHLHCILPKNCRIYFKEILLTPQK